MIIHPKFSEGDIPLGEYPRPQFVRDSYLPLNGKWQYAFTSSEEEPARYEGEILVPYSPESPYSGVGRQLTPDGFLHYMRTFALNHGFNRGRVFLNIGACDQRCKVYINGNFAGGHEGGYLPFAVELTAWLKEGENELRIVVRDDASSDEYGRGKQSYKNGGIWYMATSGIWQSVWLESVPQNYLYGLKITPDYFAGTVTLCCSAEGGGSIDYAIYDGQSLLCAEKGVPGGQNCTLDAHMCKPWSAQSPELYRVVVTSGEDRVESYFGLRSYTRCSAGGRQYMAVNGSPVFQSGLLDQGYWGDGVYTPRNNREMFGCLKRVKQAGFNMLRKHIKVEPQLWYYYCDVLGIYVWQDMLNGGAPYKKWRINLGPFINLHLDDTDYKSMGRDNPRSREMYISEASGTIDALYNCACVCVWTLFNEAWGQFDSIELWHRFASEDNTRLYDHASGWQDMGGGDFYSRHIYFRKVRLKNDKKRILALTEFGGYSFTEGRATKAFSYKNLRSREQFSRALERLYIKEIVPAIERQGLCAAVYTQLTDVEEEINGLFTREFECKTDYSLLRRINSALCSAFERLIKES